MLHLMLSLLTAASAIETFPIGDYRRLHITVPAVNDLRLPELYRVRPPSVLALDVYYGVGDSVSVAFVNGTYEVTRDNGEVVHVTTGFRQLAFAGAGDYNQNLRMAVRQKTEAARFANEPPRDVREPCFAEPAVIAVMTGATETFYQEVSLAMPPERFLDPSEPFPVQVRVKHLEQSAAPGAAIEARGFIDGMAVAEPLTAAEEQAIHRLRHLAYDCDQALGRTKH